jgi:pilus assembly protein CpaB
VPNWPLAEVPAGSLGELVQVVNLLVTPEQAQVLSLAINETRIQLVLRNPLDTQASKTTGTAMASLYGDATPTAPKNR